MDSYDRTVLTIGFTAFQEWTTQQFLSDEDSLSRLAKDWEEWMMYLSSDSRYVQQLCADAENKPDLQKNFIDWLGEQPAFQNGKLPLVLSQLVQCEEFKKWETLEPYRSIPEDFKKFGVYGVFLTDGQEGQPENVKRIVARIFPRFPTKSHQEQTPENPQPFHVFPINFNAQDDTQAAMDQAADTALELLRPRMRRLIIYLLAGDFIFLSLPRFVKIWWHTRGLYDRIKDSDIYVLIDSSTILNVKGGSLGLATCLAILMGLSDMPKGTVSEGSARFLTRFIPKFLSSLSDCAFTGEVQNGRLKAVDGIPEKIKAMNGHEAIHRGVLPKKNKPDSIGIDFTKSPVWGDSVSEVLRKLFLSRWRTWGITNAVVIGTVLNVLLLLMKFFPGPLTDIVFFPAFAPYWYDRSTPSPTLIGVGSNIEDFVKVDYFADGCPVGQFDQIKVYIGRDRGDGKTVVKVTAHPTDGQTDRYEPLRNAPEEGKKEEWHSELTLPVKHELVSFNYQHPPESEANYATLTIRVFRLGRLVDTKELTLKIR